jgi:hypothetical protein
MCAGFIPVAVYLVYNVDVESFFMWTWQFWVLFGNSSTVYKLLSLDIEWSMMQLLCTKDVCKRTSYCLGFTKLIITRVF